MITRSLNDKRLSQCLIKKKVWLGDREYYKKLTTNEVRDYNARVLRKGSESEQDVYSEKIKSYFEQQKLDLELKDKNLLNKNTSLNSEIKKSDDIKKSDSITEVTNVNILTDTMLNVRVRVGKKYVPLSIVKKLAKDHTIILDQLANDPLEIIIQNQIIAKGEVVIVDGNFGVQLVKVFDKAIEDKSYYHKSIQNKLDPVVLVESILGDVDLVISDILSFEKGSIIDLGLYAGSLSQLYADKTYIGEAEIKVWEKYIEVSFVDTKKALNSEIPKLSIDDSNQFNKLVIDRKERIAKQNYKENFASLNELSSDMLYTILSLEHPQTIAVTLLNIDDSLSKTMLKLFPNNLSYEIIIRMSRLKHVSDESLIIVSETLMKNYETKINKIDFDGLEKVTSILKLLDSNDAEEYISEIAQVDEELSDVLKKGVE